MTKEQITTAYELAIEDAMVKDKRTEVQRLLREARKHGLTEEELESMRDRIDKRFKKQGHHSSQ